MVVRGVNAFEDAGDRLLADSVYGLVERRRQGGRCNAGDGRGSRLCSWW